MSPRNIECVLSPCNPKDKYMIYIVRPTYLQNMTRSLNIIHCLFSFMKNSGKSRKLMGRNVMKELNTNGAKKPPLRTYNSKALSGKELNERSLIAYGICNGSYQEIDTLQYKIYQSIELLL